MRRWLTLILLAALSVPRAFGQASPLGSQEVAVVHALALANAASKTLIGPKLSVGTARAGLCYVNVTAISGTSTLDLYLQTWLSPITVGTSAQQPDDYCHLTQITGTGKVVFQFSGKTTSTSTIDHAVSDGSTGVTGGNCRVGTFGDTLQFAAKMGASNQTATLSIDCTFTGD